jgi:hypothetical protein
MTDSEQAYAAIVEALSGLPGVWQSTRKGFGRLGLKIDDKMFAMPHGDDLLLKLPRARVDWLVAAGEGKPFDPGHGRVMKEWVLIKPDGSVAWLDLAREAMSFVGAQASVRPPDSRSIP